MSKSKILKLTLIAMIVALLFGFNFSYAVDLNSVDDLTSILICFINKDERWSNSVKLLWVIFQLHKIDSQLVLQIINYYKLHTDLDCKILTFNPNINDENIRVIEYYWWK